MIKRKYWLLVFTVISVFCDVKSLNAKTNYDTLHTKHDIIAKYECGKLGYQATIKDGYGGYSYGKWQISTKRKNNLPSTFDFFLTYLKDNNNIYYKVLIENGGYKAAYNGNAVFIKTWKKLAKEQEFKEIYDEFLLKKEIFPVYSRMDKARNKNFDKITSWASEDNAIQAAVKSTIIQHGQGGAYRIFQNICSNENNLTKESFLKKLYNYRSMKYPEYRKRYNAEYDDLQSYLFSNKSVIKTESEKMKTVAIKVKNSDNLWNKLVKLFS